jgi:transposase-like protein DUF772
MSTSIPRWNPSTTEKPFVQKLLARMAKHRRLFVFLYQYRRELFDEKFQDQLAAMYRDTGEGKQPVPPALLAMALLLQAYTGLSDADAVDNTVLDLRWQLVLDVYGAQEPVFGQGTLQAFRDRLIRHDMDIPLIQRTVELARRSKAFDWTKLPKTLRLAERGARHLGLVAAPGAFWRTSEVPERGARHLGLDGHGGGWVEEIRGRRPWGGCGEVMPATDDGIAVASDGIAVGRDAVAVGRDAVAVAGGEGKGGGASGAWCDAGAGMAAWPAVAALSDARQGG